MKIPEDILIEVAKQTTARFGNGSEAWKEAELEYCRSLCRPPFNTITLGDLSLQLRNTRKKGLLSKVGFGRTKRRFEKPEGNYKKYLNTPEWQDIKMTVLKKHGAFCSICRSTVRVGVYHNIFRENINEPKYSDLIVLCFDCYKKNFHIMANGNDHFG